MRALEYQGPWKMPEVDIPEPVPGSHEVKIRVKYCGICGSDIHGFTGASGRKIPPMIMGHEFSGTIEEVGSDVRKLRPGMRVTVLPYSACGTCELCESGYPNLCRSRRNLGVLDVNGAFTQFICVDEDLVYVLPDTVSDITGAILEPLSVAHHAVEAAKPLNGKNVLLVGAGAIGQLILKLIRLESPATIVVSDASDAHLALARANGADVTVNPATGSLDETLQKAGLRDSIDVAIEAVGITPTVQQTVDFVKNCGRIVWVGNADKMVSINMQSIVTREIHLEGSYAFTADDFSACLELLSSHKVDPMDIVTSVITFDEVTDMMTAMAEKKTEQMKVIAEIADSIQKGSD